MLPATDSVVKLVGLPQFGDHGTVPGLAFAVCSVCGHPSDAGRRVNIRGRGAMKLSQLFSSARSSRSAQSIEAPFATGEHDLRPNDNQLDLFGLTHPGKVRAENQDHFLVGTVHPE